MIIFSQAFALAEATATPLTHSRIGYHSYIRDLLAADISASSETTNGPKSSILTPDTYSYWEGTALPGWIKADLGAARDISYGAIVGFGLSGLGVKMETSTNNVDWTQFSEERVPSGDGPLMWIGTSVVARWVRWSFTGATAPRVAVAMAGQVLAMQRAIYGGHGPIPLSRETVLHNAMSRGGQFLGQGFRRHGVSGQLSYQNLTASWYRANFDPFVKSARQYPYVVAWRPATFPLEVVYGWTAEDIRPSNSGKRDFMQVAWPIHGIGHA